MVEPEGSRKEVVVEYSGSRLRAKVDENGFYVCPLCGALFASPRDLVSHIIGHALGLPDSRRASPERP